MAAALRIYGWPSQAFWRSFEVACLRQVPCPRPILEIGCGDGQFSSLVFDRIDEAIDVNARSIARCLARTAGTYERVRCLDARDLQLEDARFATVYANCVLEHVPSIEAVLAGCFRGLRPGGRLVATVPLVRMNDHLLVRWRWYARLRQRQLCHINLFSEQEWQALLQAIGFSEVSFIPYLSGAACRFWDLLDSPGCIGFGRYRLAAASRMVLRTLVPRPLRRWGLNQLALRLSQRAARQGNAAPGCAALVLAKKSAAGGPA